MKDIAKGLAYAGIFLIPTVVLIISNSLFFPFITGKNFTFRVLAEIIFAGWVILALYDAQYRPKFSWILGAFMAFLAIMCVANIQGVYPLQSFWNNFERMEGYVTLVHTFIYFIVTGTMLRSKESWDKLFMMTVGVAIILSLYAFQQITGKITINQGGWRLDGTLGNSAYMAIYMLYHVFITLYLAIRTKSVGMRYAYGALMFLFIYLLMQTATRGTAVGLVGGLFMTVLYIALFAKEYPKARKVAFGGIAALVMLVGLFVTFKESSFIQKNPYLERIASISLKEASTRFDIWSMAFQGVKERPILGWGQSNYNYVFNKYYEPELHGQEAWFDRVHNIVMDWLIAGGVLGVVSYFAIYGAALYYLVIAPLRNKDYNAFTVAERGVLFGLLVGYLIHNVFVFDNIVSYIFYAMILGYIHSRVAKPIPKLEKAKVDIRIVDQMVVPVVIVVTAVTVYFVNVPGIRAAGDIIDAFRTQDPEVMLASFDRALAHNSFGNQEIREQMTQRVQGLLQSKEVPEEIKKKASARVEEELLKQIAEKPGDARIEVFVSSFYRSTGQFDKAAEHLKVARELSPRKQLIIYEQGFTEIQRQDFEKANQFFKEAFDLGPQFSESRVLYAVSSIYAGKLGLVDELIQTEEARNAFAMNDFAVSAVYNAKMYPRLIEMLRIRVEKKPEDTQERTSLAFVLNETGDTQGAIEVLTKAGTDIPSFKAQADQFIASIGAQKNEKVEVKKPVR